MNGGTIAEIKVELAQLKQAGFRLAVLYLERELKRRVRSTLNAGRTPVYSDLEHIKRRDAVRRSRANKRAGNTELDIDYNV